MFKDALQQNCRLYVSEVAYKSFVETSEEGTEAATVGEIFESCCFSYSESIRFTVYHPFVFMYLYKNQTLFMGKVTSL